MAASTSRRPIDGPPTAPRFGGILWKIARLTSPLTLPLAGTAVNPVFAIVEHRGRRTGRPYSTPVSVRRVEGGFVIALAFGAQVDWYRNLLAAGGGTIRWRGKRFRVEAPERIDADAAIATFHPIQRAFLRLGRIDGYVRVPDVPDTPTAA
jgi:deazaflavin-dependent oxidoreductase (nitroreductase family)